jgi:hypothetical protein
LQIGGAGWLWAGCQRQASSSVTRLTQHRIAKVRYLRIVGADAIIALRCSKLSGRFEDFWECRLPQRVPAA